MNGPSVALLTRDGVEHRFVARQLAEEFPAIRLIVETGARSSTGNSMRRAWKRGIPAFVEKIGRTLHHGLVRDGRARHQSLVSHLGDPGQAQGIYDQAVRVGNVNDSDAIRQLQEWKPDLLLVYGTGLVKGGVFDAVDCPILNMHTGLSPYYRGVACHVWPVAEDRLDRVGFTIHDCVPALDAGGILSTGVVTLEPGDTIHDVFARQVLAGGPEYARCAAAEFKVPLERVNQDLELGREYRGVSLGLSVELRARRRLRRLRREG
ncbi:MAG: formyl transferase [Phycisphaerales bacterium]|nr:formyl transferase [Phycisphaerales bacterium]